MAKEKPTAEKFFTDPAYSEEAGFMREAVDYLVTERIKKEKEANPESGDFLTKMFPWLK